MKELTKLLLDWINNVLVDQRIIVRDIEEDLFDGQILQKLYENLTDKKLPMAEVTQTEMGQKQKLRIILEEINRALGVRYSPPLFLLLLLLLLTSYSSFRSAINVSTIAGQ